MLNTLILGGFVFFFIGLWHTLFFRINLPSSKLKNFFKLVIDLFIISSIVSSWYCFKHPPVNTLELLKIGGVAYLLWYLSIYIIGRCFFNKPGHGEEEEHELSILTILKRLFIDQFRCFFNKPGEEEHELSFWKKLGIDLCIGLSMAFCLSYFHEFPFLVNPEDASMDFVIDYNSCKLDENGSGGECNFPQMEKQKNIPPVVLLDIDNETHKQRGEPLFTPRSLIKELIDAAVTGKAKVIVVDILTVQKSPVEGDDEVLRKYLATNCDGKICPPIIMASGLTGTGAGQYFTIDQPPVNQLRKSFLEEDNDIKANPLIKWASPSFIVSPSDGVLRHWWLWQPVCDENNKPEVLPSVQLLVAGLINNGGWGEIDSNLKQFEKDCSKPDKPQSLSGPINFGNLEIEEGEMAGGGIRQRIMFTMPWSSFLPQKEEQPIRYSLSNNDSNDNIRRVLTVFSANRYLKQGKPNDFLDGSIVIIGNSHFDAKDIHKTPLNVKVGKTQENDQMPGMLVIANAIYSLLLNQGEIESSKWLKYIVEAGLIGITGIVIICASSTYSSLIFWIATITTLIITYLSSQWVSALLLKHWGMWIDFSLPLVAILFHHIADELHKLKRVEKELHECRQQKETTKS